MGRIKLLKPGETYGADFLSGRGGLAGRLRLFRRNQPVGQFALGGAQQPAAEIRTLLLRPEYYRQNELRIMAVNIALTLLCASLVNFPQFVKVFYQKQPESIQRLGDDKRKSIYLSMPCRNAFKLIRRQMDNEAILNKTAFTALITHLKKETAEEAAAAQEK